MFFLVFYIMALVIASVRLVLIDAQERTRDRIIEVYLQTLLFIVYGVGGVMAFLGHKFRADETARSIGWPTGNPFQEEVAFSNLGFSLVALITAWKRGDFWLAAGLGPSIFYLGAAWVHIREAVKEGNLTINNAGSIFPDVAIPLTVLMLLFARGKQQPTAQEARLESSS